MPMTPLYYLFSLTLLAVAVGFKPAPQFSSQNSMPVLPAPDPVAAKDLIPWNRERKLTWDDFMQDPVRGTDAVASTSTSLGLSYQMKNGALTWDITCYFQKRKSWGLMKTDYILQHEQGHFDITELYARQLNKALLDYRFDKRTYKQDLNRIYADVVRAKEEFQQLYDGQTDHSRKKGIQRMWSERIEELLEESEPFADYP